MRLIDTHCHLDARRFDTDRDAVVMRAAERGVSNLIVPAVDEPSWDAIADLRDRVQTLRCHATIGIHPIAIPCLDARDDGRLLTRLDNRADSSIVAIGECGLDDTIDMDKAPYVRQEALLAGQFAIADKHGLPVILHARGRPAYDHLLRFLQRHPVPRAGGVLHSYGGGIDLLGRFKAFGLCFGFAGPATYANARKVHTSLVNVDDDRILAETDAPDQTPEPHRPGRNEPAYLTDIIEGMARARGVSAETITRLTTANAERLFSRIESRD